jgi:hypothetical protein
MADRSVSVRLKADVDQFRRDMARAADATEDVGDAAEDAGKQSRHLDELGESGRQAARALEAIGETHHDIHRVGDALGDTEQDADRLDRTIDRLQTNIRELNREFLRTGDVEVFERIGRDRGALQMLQRMRRELGDVDNASRVAANSVSLVGTSILDALRALPAQLRGGAIVAAAGIAVALAPVIGGAIAAGVIGGVGAGGIVGGLVSASRDARVQVAAQALVSRLERPFSALGEAFVNPATQALNTIGVAGESLLVGLTPEIRELAPLVVELAEGLAGMAEEAEPGIAAALREARPVIRALVQELPGLGDTISDIFGFISEGSDGAILSLKALIALTEMSAKGGALVIRTLSEAMEFLLDLMLRVGVAGSVLFGDIPVVGDIFGKLVEGGAKLKNALEDIRDAGSFTGDGLVDEFKVVAEQIDATNSILARHRDLLRAQTDPMFALIQAQQELREKQLDYNAAVDEFGTGSEAARAAQVDLALAAVGLQGAVADAAGKFDGELTPAMEATLEAAGLTRDQIDGIREAFQDAAEAGDEFAKDYFANVTVQWRQIGDPPPFGSGRLAAPFANVAFAEGGRVNGPPGIDQVPAMLTAGEHVWTVSEVKAAGGHEAVEALRAAVLGQQTRHSVSAPFGVMRHNSGSAPESVTGEFTGQLVLDSGELLGVVRGEISSHDRALKRRALAGAGATP